MTKYSLLNQIGKTPLVDVSKYSAKKSVKIYAKLEGSNPGGSIKDRVAWYMIRSAIKTGLMRKDTILIESTSGNTGIGMAMVSSALGIKFISVLPNNVSSERVKLLKAFGAEIILTDGKLGSNGAIEVVEKITKRDKKYLWLNQYANTNNVWAHYWGIGVEIVRELSSISHFVTGMGTGGTLMGAGKRLKEYSKDVKVYGVEPRENSGIFGLRNMKAYTPPIFDKRKLDGILNIKDETAYNLARNLIRESGLSVGVSSGASLWGAVELSKAIKKGVIVTVFPDRADRYISTQLFS